MLHLLRVTVGVAACAALSFGQFTDVTTDAGLGGPFIPSGGDSPKAFMSAGVAVADYDDDGFDDVAALLGSGRPLALYRNNGDGTFTEVAEDAGVAITYPHGGLLWGDYDNDGDEDLYLLPIENQVLLATMTPSGPKVIVWPVPTGLVEDGKTGYGEYRNYMLRNEGDGTFTDVTTEANLHESGRYGAAYGDLNLDGWLDLVTVTWRGDTTHFWKNDGDGTFSDRTPTNVVEDSVFGFSPHVVDYDDDSDFDILMAGDFVTSRVWRNDGGFQFTNVTDTIVDGKPLNDENGMGSAIGDYDNDGDFDWFVTSIFLAEGQQPSPTTGTTGNRLYRNNDDGTFSDVTEASGTRDGSWGWGASFLDYDNDADLDLFHVNGWNYWDYPTDTARFFESNGDGTFTEKAAELGIADPGQGRGMATFDYDRDGDLDIILNNRLEGLALYRNDTVNGNRWLEVVIDDAIGNPRGVGCEVIALEQGLPNQKRLIEYGCNFFSQNPPHAWFGFGTTAVSPVRITVRWPDGDETTELVGLNQRVTISRSGR